MTAVWMLEALWPKMSSLMPARSTLKTKAWSEGSRPALRISSRSKVIRLLACMPMPCSVRFRLVDARRPRVRIPPIVLQASLVIWPYLASELPMWMNWNRTPGEISASLPQPALVRSTPRLAAEAAFLKRSVESAAASDVPAVSSKRLPSGMCPRVTLARLPGLTNATSTPNWAKSCSRRGNLSRTAAAIDSPARFTVSRSDLSFERSVLGS